MTKIKLTTSQKLKLKAIQLGICPVYSGKNIKPLDALKEKGLIVLISGKFYCPYRGS